MLFVPLHTPDEAILLNMFTEQLSNLDYISSLIGLVFLVPISGTLFSNSSNEQIIKYENSMIGDIELIQNVLIILRERLKNKEER